MASFVDDGWTREDGYIAPAKKNSAGASLHDGLRFTYRPATRPEVMRLNDKIEKLSRTEEDSVRLEELACEFVAKRIVSWDLKNRGNHAIEVSAKACLLMNGTLFGRLYRIVQDLELSDPLPNVDSPVFGSEDLLGNSSAASG